jgi:Sulfatase-modifying factor enzyme 1
MQKPILTEMARLFLDRLIEQQDPMRNKAPIQREAQILAGRWLAIRRISLAYSLADIAQTTSILEQTLIYIEAGVGEGCQLTEAQCLHYVDLLSAQRQDFHWVWLIVSSALGVVESPDSQLFQQIQIDLDPCLDLPIVEDRCLLHERHALLLAAEYLVHGQLVRSAGLLQRLVQALALDVPLWCDAPVHICVRVGRYLTQLGDRRPGVVTTEPYWCCMDVIDPPKSAECLSEMPLMAKYPVTIQQWRYFMDDAGYTNPRWWGGTWNIRVEHGWTQPYRWEESYEQSNLPATGISWYEASAYCNWLTNVGHAAGWLGEAEEIRLPTLAEWQYATYGVSQRQFPWGDRWHPDLANTVETGIRTLVPVGCFPGGASPTGICDLVGNVWEWCRYQTNQIARVGGSYCESIVQSQQVDTSTGACERRQICGLRLVKAQRESTLSYNRRNCRVTKS